MIVNCSDADALNNWDSGKRGKVTNHNHKYCNAYLISFHLSKCFVFRDWFECQVGRVPKHILKTLVQKANISTLFSLRLISQSMDEEYFQEYLAFFSQQLNDDEIRAPAAPPKKWRKTQWPTPKHGNKETSV